MIKITSGIAKGIMLESLKGLDARPTQGRVREAIFSILGSDVAGKRFLDLFAGNGTIGIEALSRGAEYCCFVDKYRPCCEIIKRNLIKARLEEKAAVLSLNVSKAIEVLEEKGEQFDIIFTDAPYGKGLTQETLQRLSESSIIRPETIILTETAKSETLAESYAQSLNLYDKRIWGDTCVWFYRCGE